MVEEIEICFYDLLIVLHYRFVLSFLLICIYAHLTWAASDSNELLGSCSLFNQVRYKPV